jgi:hypothetical protein
MVFSFGRLGRTQQRVVDTASAGEEVLDVGGKELSRFGKPLFQSSK